MGERPQRYFLEPVDQSLECQICGQIFHDPHIIDCGHTFCYACITLLRTSQKSCIVCHKFFKTVSLIPNISLSEIIGKLKTKCAFYNCSWTGLCFDLKLHRSICSFRPKKVHQPVFPELIIDLEGSQVGNRGEFDHKKFGKNNCNYSTSKREGFYPFPLSNTNFQGFKVKQRMFLGPQSAAVQKSEKLESKGTAKDVLEGYKSEKIDQNQFIRFGKTDFLPQALFSYPFEPGNQHNFPFSSEQSAFMVDESDQIQDSNRSSNLNDQKNIGRQFFFLSESSDLYQPEEQEFEKTVKHEKTKKVKQLSSNSHQMTTRSRAISRRDHSQGYLSIQPPTFLRSRQSAETRSAGQMQNFKEPEFFNEPQN